MGRIPAAAEVEQYRAEIDRIDHAVSLIPVPLHYSDQHYELRAAIDLVRQRTSGPALARLAG